MRNSNPITQTSRIIVIMLVAGSLYAGQATVRRYVEIYRSPLRSDVSASIDRHLVPAGVTAEELREAVERAGWQPGDDVLVVASERPATREDLYQVYYSTGYLLYPSRVDVATDAMPAVGLRERRVVLRISHLGETSALITVNR